MKLVDANVLLSAVNEDATRHAEARTWLDSALSGGDTVGFAWIVLLAFVRLSTRPQIFPAPLAVEDALSRIDEWIEAEPAVVVETTTEHRRHLRSLLASAGMGGKLVSDAHLAALALEHRATVVTYDTDFARFDGIRTEQPSAPEPDDA